MPPPLSRLGRYDIVRVLGQGAMGVVYEARDPNLGRRVAIKTVRVAGMPAEEAQDYEKRFDTEARSAGRLQHPNIVSVYDSSSHEDAYGKTAYIVMEFVEGEDIKHMLDKGHRFSLQQTVRIMDDLLTALDVAHRNKIIHRDVKPANLMLTKEGRIKLTDFGVARIQDSGEATKTQGSTVGTLKYMSPEQVAGRGVDASSDLFSAGIVLYQLLTGVRPFDGDGYLDIVSKIVKQDPKPPSQLVSALPLGLDEVVLKALAKSKFERFSDATSFAQALKEAVSQADLSITPTLHKSLASTVSSSGTGNVNTSSTITQELELVYWKDIKESQNPDILEGFLRRFPEGVYADLAKHKLKEVIDDQKAAGQASRYESTELSLRTPQIAQAAQTRLDAKHSSDSTATLPLGRNDPTTPLPQLAQASATDGAASQAPHIVYADVMDSWPAGMSPDGGGDAAPPSPKPSAAKSQADTHPAPSHRVWLVAGVTALGLMAVSALFLRTPSPSPASLAASTSPTVTMSITTTGALTPTPVEPVLNTPTTPQATSSLAESNSASQPEASTATAAVTSNARAASASRKARPTETASRSRTAAAQDNQEASDKSSSDSLRVPANPRAACAGRMLLGYFTCMTEQCAKPIYRNHRVCVERREAEERRLRQETAR